MPLNKRNHVATKAFVVDPNRPRISISLQIMNLQLTVSTALAAEINYSSSAKTNYELVNEKVCSVAQSGHQIFRLFGFRVAVEMYVDVQSFSLSHTYRNQRSAELGRKFQYLMDHGL